MKEKVLLFTTCLLLATFTSCASSKRIVGNGKLVTKEFKIGNYNGIDICGPIHFDYKCTSEAPRLQVTVDENIMPYVCVKISSGTLEVSFCEKKGKVFDDDNYIQVRPTKCIVKSNSSKLNDISVLGGSNLSIADPFVTNNINMDISGGGSVLAKNLKANKVLCEVAGGGTIDLNCTTQSGKYEVSGGGTVELAGTSENGHFEVSGGGRVEAYSYKVKDANCDVSGGGTVKVFVTNTLNADVSGGGDVYYKGNPEVEKSVSGGGSVRKAREE